MGKPYTLNGRFLHQLDPATGRQIPPTLRIPDEWEGEPTRINVKDVQVDFPGVVDAIEDWIDQGHEVVIVDASRKPIARVGKDKNGLTVSKP